MNLTPRMLRGVLVADAAISGATGLLLVIAGAWLADLLALPTALLRYAGLSLLPFAAVVAWVAARDPLSRPAVKAIVVANAAWVVASIGVLFTGHVSPNALGFAFVLAQAIAVGALADVQFVGLRRLSHATS